MLTQLSLLPFSPLETHINFVGHNLENFNLPPPNNSIIQIQNYVTLNKREIIGMLELNVMYPPRTWPTIRRR